MEKPRSHLVREYKTLKAAVCLQQRLQNFQLARGHNSKIVICEVSTHKKRLILPGKKIYQVIQIDRPQNV